ncbi:hypothetical protein [Microbacterium sp. YY-01]|uniref:peptidylprolyl isomerase n=1 Tax=Microbacterium sp. YY-01 TaxID=3421634 RepID=UPI003D172C97
MTRSSRTAVIPRMLCRAGITAVLTVSIVTTAAACTPATVQHEVAAVYEQAEGVVLDAKESAMERDIAIIDWAIEAGIIERFETAEFADDSAVPTNDTQFGAQTMTTWQRYRDYVEQLAQGLRDKLRDELTIDDVREFYQQHPEAFTRVDDVVIEVTEWHDGRAVETFSVEIDETTVRELQERDDAVIAAALDLAEGATVTVDRGDGRYALVRCVSRHDGGVMPFDDVVQAAAMQRADELFRQALEARLAG